MVNICCAWISTHASAVAAAVIAAAALAPVQYAAAQVAPTAAKDAARIAALEKALGADWRCVLLPDGLKPPGSVYRVTKTGAIFEVEDFSKAFRSTRTVPGSIGSFTSDESYELELLASITGIKAAIGKAHLQASSSKRYAFSATVPDARKETTKDEDPGRAAVKKWFAKADRDPQSAYYLVREALVTRSVVFHFGQDFAAAVLAQANAKSFLKGKIRGELSASNGFILVQDYPSDVRVCLLPEQLVVARANLDGTPLTESNVELRRDSRFFNVTTLGGN